MNSRKLFCLLITVFLIKTLFSQANIDSLTNEFLNVQDKHKKIELGITISRSYLNTNKDSAHKYLKKARLLLDVYPDTYLNAYYNQSLGNFHTKLFENELAIGYLKKSYNLYSSIDSTYDMAIVNTLIGNSFENLLNYDSSLYYYELSNESIDSINHAALIAANLNNMANVYKTVDDVDKALNCYLDALVIFKRISQKENAAITLNNIGILNLDEDMPTKSIEYINQAIALNLEINNQYGLCSDYNMLGLAYRELDNYDSAITYLVKAIDIAEFLNYNYLIAQSNHNLGTIYLKTEEYEKAINHFSKSLEIAIHFGIVNGEIINIINLGRIYTKKGDYSSANDYLFNALKLCEQNNLTEHNEGLYLAITTNFEKWEKYNLSLEYFQLYSNIRDSLLNIERLNEIHSIQVQYETEQKDLENQRLKDENKLQEYVILKQRLYNIGYIIFLTIAILIIFMLIKMRRNRKKRIQLLQAKNRKIQEQSQELTLSNQTKDMLFSIIAHDLRSPFTSLLGFSSMLYDESTEGNYENTITYSKHLNSVIINTYELVDNLLNWSRYQQNSIKMNPKWMKISETIDEILQSHNTQAEEKQITIDSKINPETKIFADKDILLVIIRNLLSNAIKFTPKGGKITINCIDNSQEFIISIQDNGVGIEPNIVDTLFTYNSGHSTPGTENEKGSGLGLMLVKDFVDKIGGTIWIESIPDKGSTFSFSITKVREN